jgi:PAS domain S-box-containing protein
MNKDSGIVLSKKLLIRGILITVIPAILISVYFVISFNGLRQNYIEMEGKQFNTNLIRLTTMVKNSIQPQLLAIRNGEITEPEGLEQIREMLRLHIYQDEYGPNYIFLFSETGRGYVHPFDQSKEDADLWNIQDEDGVFYIQDLVKAAKSSPNGGFSTYQYLLPGSTETQKKISHAIYIPEIHAVLGTGIYLDKYFKTQYELLKTNQKMIYGFVVFMALSLGLSLYHITKSHRLLVGEIGERKAAQANTLRSERNLQHVFDGSYDAIFIHDFFGNIKEMNERALKMYEFDLRMVTDLHISDIAAPDHQGKFLENIWNQVNSGEKFIFEWFCKKYGQEQGFFVEVGIRQIDWYDEPMILAVVRDISERKQQEAELSEREARLRSILENAHEAIHLLDEEGRIIEWNRATADLTGASREDAIGKYLWEIMSGLFPNSQYDDTFLKIKNMVAADHAVVQTSNTEFQFKDKFGKPHFLIHNLFSIPTPKGVRIGAIIHDISEIKMTEIKLAESEERLRMIIEQMKEGVIVVDEEGKIIEWNPSYEEMTGISRSEVVGKFIWDLQFSFVPEEKQTSEKLEAIKAAAYSVLFDPNSAYLNKPAVIQLKLPAGYLVLEQTIFRIHTHNGLNVVTIVRNITDQQLARQNIQYQLRKLESLRRIDTSIIGNHSLKETMTIVVDQAVEQLHIDGINILILHNGSTHLKKIASHGLLLSELECPRFDDHLGIGWRVLDEGKLVKINLHDHTTRNTCLCFDHKRFATYVGAPILSRNGVLGVVEAFIKKDVILDQEWFDYYETLVGQIAIAIESNRMLVDLETTNQNLLDAYEKTISGWSKALELKDKETQGHSDRVMKMGCKLAERFGYSGDAMVHFRWGVLLHDIGKMGIPDEILFKPGPLSDSEWEIMRQHPKFAYELLKPIEFLQPVLDIPHHHHERWDGSGYPGALKGKEIPLSARIFAIVDVWDALIEDRPYRKAWDTEKVKRYLQENSGIQFDPEVTDIFLEMMNEPEDYGSVEPILALQEN